MTEINFAIAICSRCGGANQPGEAFRVETVACFAGCERPLTVAFTEPVKAAFFFGDFDTVADVDAHLSFGRLCWSLSEAWCKESERPPGLRSKTLARIPFIGGLTS